MMNRKNDEINCPEMDYFMNEDLCDVVFLVDRQRIPAPKQLLCLKSRVFRAMFLGNFREAEEKVIPIEDTIVEAFKTFIRFLICDQLVFNDVNDFQLIGEVFRLSDKYQVSRLSNKVTDNIWPRVDLANLRSVSRIAFDYNMNELMSVVVDFCYSNINELIHKDIEELAEINECTNDLMFNLLTTCGEIKFSQGLVQFIIGDKKLFVKREVIEKANFSFTSKEMILNEYGMVNEGLYNPGPLFGHMHFLIHLGQCYIDGSFEAFKVLIGFLYFNRLILKDKNDFKLIQEVCEMSERYSVNGLVNEIRSE